MIAAPRRWTILRAFVQHWVGRAWGLQRPRRLSGRGTMMLRRWGLVAALAALAWVVAPAAGQAQDTVLKWGDNLSPSVDPHALSDVPSAFTRLNMYDSLLRVV